MIIHDEGVLLTHDGVLVFWRRAARRPTRVARPRDSSRWTDTPPESNEVPVSTTGLPGHYTSQRLLRRLFHFAWWMTFESPHYPPKWARCLSAMTYRSLLSKRTMGGQEDREGQVCCRLLPDAGLYKFKPPTAWALQYATCGHS